MLIKTDTGNYELKYEPKAQRALEAATLVSRQEKRDATGEEILAEYDKLAGLIQKDGVVVPTGTFWDFDNKVSKLKKEEPVAEKTAPEVIDGAEVVGHDTVAINIPKAPKKAKKTPKAAEAPIVPPANPSN